MHAGENGMQGVHVGHAGGNGHFGHIDKNACSMSVSMHIRRI